MTTDFTVWARAGGKQNFGHLAWRGIHVKVQAAVLAGRVGASLADLGTRLSHRPVRVGWVIRS